MKRRVAFAPSIWLVLAAIALLWGSHSATAASSLQEAEPAASAAGSLPAPLYYIDLPSGQIVRLDVDGLTRRTVTHEVNPITVFEAALTHGPYFVRVDILKKDGNRVDLIEVKG